MDDWIGPFVAAVELERLDIGSGGAKARDVPLKKPVQSLNRDKGPSLHTGDPLHSRKLGFPRFRIAVESDEQADRLAVRRCDEIPSMDRRRDRPFDHQITLTASEAVVKGLYS